MAIITETYTKDRQLSKHFALHEFKCKVSDTIKYSEETIELLEKVFALCSKISKAIITSGYRTPEYSVKVGGAKDDGHTVGIAVDVKWYDRQNHIVPPKYIACIAQELGFTGIGLMSNSIHLDTRTKENYKNGKWWGDETNGKNNITDFYSYTGLSREEVYKVLGVVTEKTEEKPTEPPKVEEPKIEPTEPIAPVPSKPIKPNTETLLPEVFEEITEDKAEVVETPTATVIIKPVEEETGKPDPIITKDNGFNILSIFKLIIEFISKLFKKEK